MHEMGLQEFEELVAETLDTLSPEMLQKLDNVIFLVENRAKNEPNLLGVYEGFSLLDRSQYGYGEEPDRIILFKEPLLAICSTREELKHEIRITLVHEIAHFYGLSEERIQELGWG